MPFLVQNTTVIRSSSKQTSPPTEKAATREEGCSEGKDEGFTQSNTVILSNRNIVVLTAPLG